MDNSSESQNKFQILNFAVSLQAYRSVDDAPITVALLGRPTFRKTDTHFSFLNNGNSLGFVKLLAQFDPVLHRGGKNIGF